MTEPPRVSAVLTAHNRKEKTLTALESFFRQEGNAVLNGVLMDDGSTDGTAETVAERYPKVRVLKGDGSLYWNQGMAAAFEAARSGAADYYLWLNDDTVLDEDTLIRMLFDAGKVQSEKGILLVGSTRDPETGELTYGGLRRSSRWHPGKFRLRCPGNSPLPCDAMNGNIVLISNRAAELVGGIDRRFTHSMGDFDYALRARRLGIPVFVGAGFHGLCPRNSAGSAWHEQVGLRARLKCVNSPKGLPMKEWAYFLRKHGHIGWPLAWLSSYRRIVTG